MKYLGLKNRIAKELVPIIQKYITNDTNGYLETCVGGANIIDKIIYIKKVIKYYNLNYKSKSRETTNRFNSRTY